MGKRKKSELCVAGENLLELERTKGGIGGGSGCRGGHIATKTLKMANDFYNLHLIKSKSAQNMYDVPLAVGRGFLRQKNCSNTVPKDINLKVDLALRALIPFKVWGTMGLVDGAINPMQQPEFV